MLFAAHAGFLQSLCKRPWGSRWMTLLRGGGIAGGIIAMMSALPVLGADSAPPVVLPAFNVIESALKVKVLISYRAFKGGHPFVTAMMVHDVKTPSFAQEAGLKSGMEIIAIQGQQVSGLSQAAVEQLLSQPARDSVVLLVRRSWLKRPEEILISVRPP